MNQLKGILLTAGLAFCTPIWALGNIQVKVETDYKRAAAIGFKVDGKEYGALGKSYSGVAPADKLYRFGLRKDSIFGSNLDCGALLLTHNARVNLVVVDDVCQAHLG